MKYVFIFLVFCSLLLVSCKNNSNPIEQGINSEDLILKKKLIGGWKFAGNYIHFMEDGTYIDSSFFNPTGTTFNICSDVRRNGLYLNQITKGFFSIENGILIKQPMEYVLDCNPLKAPACRLYFDCKIEIKNDTLKLTTEHVWEKNSNNNNIWGGWKQSYWAWSYHSILPSNRSAKQLLETITFFQDSSVFHQKIVGLPYEGKLVRRSFIYNPPQLNVNDAFKFYVVTFKNDKMHWTEKNWSWYYIRI